MIFFFTVTVTQSNIRKLTNEDLHYLKYSFRGKLNLFKPYLMLTLEGRKEAPPDSSPLSLPLLPPDINIADLYKGLLLTP